MYGLSADKPGGAGDRRPLPRHCCTVLGDAAFESAVPPAVPPQGQELRLPRGLRTAGLGLPLPAPGRRRVPSHLRKAPKRAPAGAGGRGVCSCVRSGSPSSLPSQSPSVSPQVGGRSSQPGAGGYATRGKAHGVGDRMRRGGPCRWLHAGSGPFGRGAAAALPGGGSGESGGRRGGWGHPRGKGEASQRGSRQHGQPCGGGWRRAEGRDARGSGLYGREGSAWGSPSSSPRPALNPRVPPRHLRALGKRPRRSAEPGALLRHRIPGERPFPEGAGG